MTHRLSPCIVEGRLFIKHKFTSDSLLRLLTPTRLECICITDKAWGPMRRPNFHRISRKARYPCINRLPHIMVSFFPISLRYARCNVGSARSRIPIRIRIFTPHALKLREYLGCGAIRKQDKYSFASNRQWSSNYRPSSVMKQKKRIVLRGASSPLGPILRIDLAIEKFLLSVVMFVHILHTLMRDAVSKVIVSTFIGVGRKCTGAFIRVANADYRPVFRRVIIEK